MFSEKYHLPHNSIRIDEFNHMLSCIDTEKEYYTYEDLRLLFLQKQIKEKKLEIFHPKYDENLKKHRKKSIRIIYESCKENPNIKNINELYDVAYTDRKNFRQVWNETVRDYTEFFAFLGLLPTYYKGKAGGEKYHYVSQRLKEYLNKKISLEEILLEFKFRNSSKNFDNLSMYQIEVRPFCLALKVAYYYFNKGYEKINPDILSAIVIYSKNEDISSMTQIFKNPTLKIDTYKNNFNTQEFPNIKRELTRATLLLRPYLLFMGYVEKQGKYYVKGNKQLSRNTFTEKSVYVNSLIGNSLITLTPSVGKVMYNIYKLAKTNNYNVGYSDVFDDNIDVNDRKYILSVLKNNNCVVKFDDKKIVLNTFFEQFSINPYTDFSTIDEANYVEGINNMELSAGQLEVKTKDTKIEDEIESIRSTALNDNKVAKTGAKYEELIYNFIKKNYRLFDVQWYGGNTTGQRLSDIVIRTKVNDNNKIRNIVIVIECKAGRAIKAFDERKEIDDISNTLQKEKDVDGVWYWILDGNSLPSVDEHGGYRENALSKSFGAKLLAIQFAINQTIGKPTLITAFSFDAIKIYLTYLHERVNCITIDNINKVNVPHFWSWSKKFMNMQFIHVYDKLTLGD